jgi:hypothetical protein
MMSFSTLSKLEEYGARGRVAVSATEHEVVSLTDAYAGHRSAASRRRSRIAAAAVRKEVHPLKPVHANFRDKQRRHADLAARHADLAVADEKCQRLKVKNPASPNTRRLMNELEDREANFEAVTDHGSSQALRLMMVLSIQIRWEFYVAKVPCPLPVIHRVTVTISPGIANGIRGTAVEWDSGPEIRDSRADRRTGIKCDRCERMTVGKARFTNHFK